jgi:hypothetical protein
MDVWATFVSNPQSPELMQPSQGALDYPPEHTQATPMGRVTFGQYWLDAQYP